MPLDEDNIIEQLAQIESELSGTSTTEGEISNVSQVDSVVASVIPVDISQNYRGTIGEEDWVLRDDGFYYYKVTYATHRLLTPYVDKYLVATEDGYENESKQVAHQRAGSCDDEGETGYPNQREKETILPLILIFIN